MSKETELLPCPFCGCALEAHWRRANPKAMCRTEGCVGAKLPILNLDQPEAIAAWNTRAADRELRRGDDQDLAQLHENGAKAWADVPDATAWVDELRGSDGIGPSPERVEKPAADVQMPQESVSRGFVTVRLIDAQVALVAKEAEIAALKKKVGAYQLLTKSQDVRIATVRKLRDEAGKAIAAFTTASTVNTMLTNQIVALKAERDALKVAAKYAEHIDATPENQLQTMLHDTMTERDALRRIGGQLSNIAFNVSQNPDRVLSVAVCSTLDKIRKEWDAAIAKE